VPDEFSIVKGPIVWVPSSDALKLINNRISDDTDVPAGVVIEENEWEVLLPIYCSPGEKTGTHCTEDRFSPLRIISHWKISPV